MTLHESLGHDAQTLLNEARTLDEPNEVDRARIWRSFERAAVLGASAGVAAYGGTAAHQASALGVRLGVKSAWIKAGCVALAAAGLAGGYWGWGMVSPASDSGTPALESPTRQAAKVVIETDAPKPATSNTQEQLLAETRLLQAAQASLTAGQAEQALAAVAEHRARFPSGILAPERDAVKVFALCASGRAAAARDAAAAFVAAHPASPLLAKVRGACGAPGAKR